MSTYATLRNEFIAENKANYKIRKDAKIHPEKKDLSNNQEIVIAKEKEVKITEESERAKEIKTEVAVFEEKSEQERGGPKK